jgi:UDP-glucose 4-epimerase
MATILVTGGAGYVGSVCCWQLLEQGHRVAVIDDLSTGHVVAVPPGATLHQIDVSNIAAVAEVLSSDRFDMVFHFAAKALISESVLNPGLFFDANVARSIMFLEAVRAANIRKFVFSSSAAVYGNPHSAPIEESCPKEPVNAYGETKLMLERVLHWYASAYRWTVVAFRYFNASGATELVGEDHRPETHIIPLLLQTAAGERQCFEVYGHDYPTPDGTCRRDYVHVSDIAQAHLLAMHVHDPGMFAYNIGTGTSYSVREVCAVVREVVGHSLNINEAPRRPGDPAVLCASPRRLIEQLGWAPRCSDLHSIVRTAWEWKKKHPNGYQDLETETVVPSL